MIKSSKFIKKTAYFFRDLRSMAMMAAIKKYCRGDVLDVGGGDFFSRAQDNFYFKTWVSLEQSKKYAANFPDLRYRLVIGDGQAMSFPKNSFDTVLCIQVLEHVMEPNKMMAEIARVLRPDGVAILLVPQTANIHLVPQVFYNFTKYWIKNIAKRCGLKIVTIKPIGGFWSTTASRFAYFFLQSLGYEIMSDKENLRSWLFFVLFPFAWIFAFCATVISLVLSLGDLTEEPNNHLVVLKKINHSR